MLGALAWKFCGLAFALRMVPVAYLATLTVVRQIYSGFGIEKPLSVAPDAIAAEQSWFNAMMVIALILTIVAVFAVKLLASPLICVGTIAALLAMEWSQDRAHRVGA